MSETEEREEKEEKKISEKASKQITIVRIRGSIKVNKEINDTLNMLRLYKRNYCVVMSSTPSILGMIQKVKDYITWGEINEETLKLLKDKRYYEEHGEVRVHLALIEAALGDFERSLEVLNTVKMLDPIMITKSGMMVGVGETREQLIRTFKRLADVKIDILTIGQYFQADKALLPVEKYLSDEEFIELRNLALNNNIKYVVSGKYVRSSYKARNAFFFVNFRAKNY